MAAGTAPWLVQLPRVTAVTENPVQVGVISRLWLYVDLGLSSLHGSRFCFRLAERRSAGDAGERSNEVEGGGLAKTWRKRLLYDPLHRPRFGLSIALFVLCFAPRRSLVCSLHLMAKVTSPRCFFHFLLIFTTKILCRGNPAWLAVFLETCA